MSRHFFAIIPPVPQQAAIERLRVRFGSPHHKVEPHITVKVPFAWQSDPEPFLGPVRAACAAHPVFMVTLGAPARFPDAGVLFLTVSGQGCHTLHQGVLTALTGLVPVDQRGHEGPGYSPHLTLAVSRFDIDEAGMTRMEQEAAQELSGTAPFLVTALRCYVRQKADEPWERFCDLPLGAGQSLL